MSNSGASTATGPRVVGVSPDSPAAAAGLLPGDEIRRVNGRIPRDIIEWQLAIDEPHIDLAVARQGLEFDVEIERDPGRSLGIEVHSAVFDRVRTCDNHCEFCFIHQLPKGMRRSLYLKDDDYRLSFLYGNFTTLTRFTEADLERVIDERLSPLHVSIHATDGATRADMLRNRRGAMSLRWLSELLRHGIEVRGQLVVCPGVNDAEVLERTLAGIVDRFPQLSSVAVVPLGVSRFNPSDQMRPHTRDEAAAVINAITRWQHTCRELFGRALFFAADEYYLLAGEPMPALETYEGCPMHEDGIGMARTFEAEFDGSASTTTGPRRGFFAAVDLPDNPAAYTGLRAQPVRLSRTRASASTGPIHVLTGELGAQVIGPLIASLGRDDVVVTPVPNHHFGGNTGVTGLMCFSDIAEVLADIAPAARILLPDVCLSDDGRFLDGPHLDDLPREVEVIPTDGGSLRAALEESR